MIRKSKMLFYGGVGQGEFVKRCRCGWFSMGERFGCPVQNTNYSSWELARLLKKSDPFTSGAKQARKAYLGG